MNMNTIQKSMAKASVIRPSNLFAPQHLIVLLAKQKPLTKKYHYVSSTSTANPSKTNKKE